MDAERAQQSSDPNDIFVNQPDSEYGPSGYGEINLGYRVGSTIAAGLRWVRRQGVALVRRVGRRA